MCLLPMTMLIARWQIDSNRRTEIITISLDLRLIPIFAIIQCEIARVCWSGTIYVEINMFWWSSPFSRLRFCSRVPKFFCATMRRSIKCSCNDLTFIIRHSDRLVSCLDFSTRQLSAQGVSENSCQMIMSTYSTTEKPKIDHNWR